MKREREDHGLSSKAFTRCLDSLFYSSAATNMCLCGYSLNCHDHLLLRGGGGGGRMGLGTMGTQAARTVLGFQGS